jgi:hypothetical protein
MTSSVAMDASVEFGWQARRSCSTDVWSVMTAALPLTYISSHGHVADEEAQQEEQEEEEEEEKEEEEEEGEEEEDLSFLCRYFTPPWLFEGLTFFLKV